MEKPKPICLVPHPPSAPSSQPAPYGQQVPDPASTSPVPGTVHGCVHPCGDQQSRHVTEWGKVTEPDH